MGNSATNARTVARIVRAAMDRPGHWVEAGVYHGMYGADGADRAAERFRRAGLPRGVRLLAKSDGVSSSKLLVIYWKEPHDV